MDDNQEQNCGIRTRSICVKFTAKQYKRIKKDAEFLRSSIPELLRACYLKHPLVVPLMSPEATDAALNQLRTMTNHFNVVARALDSGFRAGWNGDIGQIRNDLSDLRRLIVGLRPEHP